LAQPKVRLRSLHDLQKFVEAEGLRLAISAKAGIFHVTIWRRGFVRATVSECSLHEAFDKALLALQPKKQPKKKEKKRT
jgi:hypothetical protein